LDELHATRCDRALRRGLFPDSLQADHSNGFIALVGCGFKRLSLSRVNGKPICHLALRGICAHWLARLVAAKPRFVEDAAAGFNCGVADLLLCHELRLMGVRAELSEDIRWFRAGAKHRAARLQRRHARLDVFAQFASRRSLFHSVVRGVHELRAKNQPACWRCIASRRLDFMQPVEQRDEVEMLSLMLLIRRFEERASQQYQAQKIGGFCHLYIGQEAVVTGAVAAIRDDDYVITAYRDHAHALARGTSANACMAELFGKATGCSRGLGGSMHFFDKQHHMYGGHAIVAAHVPLGVGLAFAIKYRGEDRVTLCFFGDGAINQGAFHEALNLAALYSLPIVFICENNLFAMGTSVKRSTSLKQIIDRAEGYDIPGEIVDGMNFREVRDKISEVVDSIRKEPHPAFLEARTYRYRGHSMSDPASYRTKDELEKYRLDDPITRLRAQLTREGKLTNEQFDQLDKRAKETVMAAIKFAEESPDPPLEKLYDYTYANGAKA
jgi:pyruvate dehydrogenase E1 component subunit alpha